MISIGLAIGSTVEAPPLEEAQTTIVEGGSQLLDVMHELTLCCSEYVVNIIFIHAYTC